MENKTTRTVVIVVSAVVLSVAIAYVVVSLGDKKFTKQSTEEIPFFTADDELRRRRIEEAHEDDPLVLGNFTSQEADNADNALREERRNESGDLPSSFSSNIQDGMNPFADDVIRLERMKK